jgi:hypothetical protein
MMGELTVCGQSRLMHARPLLTQHFLAVAANLMLRCSLNRGSGHSMSSMSVDFKPTFRRILHQLTECGQTGLMQVQLLLTQHSFAFAASLSLHCSLGRGSGHSMVPITVNFKPTLRRIMFDNHTSPDNATFAVGVLRPIRHDLVQAATSRRLQGFRFKAPIP